MDSLEKHRLYQRQLRNLYTQVSSKRNIKTKLEDEKDDKKEELNAINIKATIPENMPKEVLKRSNVVKKIAKDSTENSKAKSIIVENRQDENEKLNGIMTDIINEINQDSSKGTEERKEKIEEEVPSVNHSIKREELEENLTSTIEKYANKMNQDSVEENENIEGIKIVSIETLEQERMSELQTVIQEKFPESVPPKSFKEAMEREMAKYGDLEVKAEPKSLKITKRDSLFQRIKNKTKVLVEKMTTKQSERESTKSTSLFQKISQKGKSFMHSIGQKPKISTRWKAAIAAVFILVTGSVVHSLYKNGKDREFTKANKAISQTFEKDMSADTTESLALGRIAKLNLKENVYKINNSMTKVNVEQEKEVEKEIEKAEISQNDVSLNEEDNLLLGKSIKLNEGIPVYVTEQDAYLEENGLSSYYPNEDERVIIGVLISSGDNMMRICADQEAANAKITNIIANGGEIHSILTANKAYVLSDYDGTKILSSEEIGTSAEGWYNVHDIQKEHAKTYHK